MEQRWSERVPAPSGRFFPPVLVVLGVAAYIAEHRSRDSFEFMLIVAFVLLPGALTFVCGYAAGYLLLRRRQRAGARPRSGTAVVLLAVLIGIALLAVMLSFVFAVSAVPSEPAQTVTAAPIDAEPASPPPQAPAVTSAITRDGRPFIPNTLWVWRRGEGMRLFVSDRFRSCAEAIDEGQTYFDDETYLWIDLARQLSPIGALGWRFAGLHVAYGEDRDPPDRARTVEVVGDGAPGEPTTITVAAAARTHSVPTLGVGNGSIHELVVQGPLTAIGCEVDVPTAPAQSGSLRVAGMRLPIVGAIVRRSGDVVLSSAALECKQASAGALTITLSGTRETQRQIAVSGEWLRDSKIGSVTNDAQPWAAVRRQGRGRAKLALWGMTVVDGYSVSIEGDVLATVCRE